MKTKLFVLVFLALDIVPAFLYAQFTQQGPKLVGAGSVGQSQEGRSVAISSDGNTAVLGGPFDNNGKGAIWIFTRTGGVWTQQGSKLVGTGGVLNNNQGWSVAISSDGNTVIAGAPGDNSAIGAFWIFTRSGGVWLQQGSKLTCTGVIGNAQVGYSVAISSDGNTVAVGGYKDNTNAGAIWIFTRTSGVWTQQGSKLVGTGTVGSAGQGWSDALTSDGNTVIEGGYTDNASAGALWVFTRSAGVWTQQGTKLVGTGGTGISQMGISVSISSDGSAAVAGGNEDNNFYGAIWVFTRSGSVWSQQGPKLVGAGGIGASLELGWSVSITPDGNSIAAGGPVDNGQVGAVWVFTRSGGVWTQFGSKFTGTNPVGSFVRQGYCVSISSEGTVIEGGLSDSNNTGAAWIFSDPTIGITPISNETPKDFSLSQNYPNPFNPNSKIRFQIAKGVRSETSDVRLIVYNLLGEVVTTLVNERLNPGTYEVDFNGSRFASGVYFYALKTENYSETKKMLMVK